ncbi:MAG: hypothetical protein JNM86_11190 [Phycisphaerae bacterium]|nr:hypothetical protein [Phycisphaerae bacterium]
MNKSHLNEASLESVLEAVRAYAAIAGHIDTLVDLEQRISQSWARATEQPFSFDDHSMILGRAKRTDITTRWSAWIAQRIFNCRATCVGNHLVQVRGAKPESPVLQQLEHYGLETRPVDLDDVIKFGTKSPVPPHKCIDGLLISAGAGELVVVRSAKLQRQRSTESPTLFNPSPRPVASSAISSRTIASLIQSEFLLRSALPSAKIRCVVALVDSDVESREFYLYETTGAFYRQIQGPNFNLGSLPLLASSRDILAKGEDLEEIANPPSWVVREPLMRLPVDRATRAMMILDVLWQLQASSPGLVAMGVSEIAQEVQKRFLIEYTSDHQRHDLEDCLVNGKFIEQPTYEKKCFALTPAGVFQALVGRRMLQIVRRPKGEDDADPFILAPIRRQARLWARYYRGEQVIDAQ